MRILEQFLIGKKGQPDGGEDRLVVTPHFLAVIDGATAKKVYDFGGPTGGALVANTLARAIPLLDPHCTASTATAAFTALVKQQVFDAFGLAPAAGEDRPCANIVLYSVARREIWRVGDSHFAINGTPNHGGKQIDQQNAAHRAAINQAFLHHGGTLEELAVHDIGRAAIQSSLNSQSMFMNNEAAGKYGFGAIDGRPVPAKFIETFPVPAGAVVTLASDGYLALQPTLTESESYLADYLRHDPQMIGVHASTKGLAKDQLSFDDRAWLRFAP